MVSWQADPELSELIRRYYAGEAGLWEEIRGRVDSELRRRGVGTVGHHIRLRRRDDGYEVQIDDAAGFVNEP